MKPAQERNQECLPPKKRDLPISNSSGAGGTAGSGAAAGGGGIAGGSAGGCVGEDEVVSIQNSAPNSDTQGGAPSGEWLRAQPGLHYGVENSDGIPAVPVDQYSMLYKVALPSVTYAPTSLHPVLSHISPAYTVHSPLLQHPGLPYPPLGYAQIPHSSLQFVSSPYAAVPYALPPGFVPGSLISPSGTIPQPHAVSHLVPYPSVIQEGVVSPPPQAQVAAHTFAKVAASSGVPLMLPSEQAAQQHLGTVGVLPAAELSSRGMPVFYHPQGARATATRDCHSSQQENEPEMNGGDKEQGAREVVPESAYTARNTRLPQVASISAAQEHSQDKVLHSRRLEERGSPGQRSTPDSDLEVQQVVGRLASSSQGGSGVRKEVSFAPLNLSQGGQRARDVHGESKGVISARTGYTAQPASYSDHRVAGLPQQTGQPGHAVMLANGQPVLIPLEYHPHQAPQQHYPGQANDASASHASATMASSSSSFKASDSLARVCLPERAEPTTAQQQQLPLQPPVQPTAEMTQALASSLAPASAPCNPSHFMKGAIIQLATGELKRVEDLQTQDFVRSAEVSGGLKIDSSLVMDIRPSQQRPGLVSLHFTVGEQQSKVTIDVPPEHPFFVFGQGWSSCSPERTAQLYGLACHHLQVGDMCVSITLQQQLQPQQQKQPQHHHSQQQQQQQNLSRTLSKTNATGPGHQLMGPPAPQQSRPQSHFRMDRIHRERQRDGEKEVVDKEEATHLGAVGHTELPIRPSRTSAEHPRSQSSYHLHTEGSAFAEAGIGAMQAALGASQRRWSSPGLQRYSMKGDEGPRPQIITSGHTRPSFIPQEVKLSIEGRSNAGK
ncbi:ataxin-1-like [Stegastes partitus]|uniref:Ataxin-1-like n=1 Tax=Stegastes partitus TaxID=144197 RepID=A0A3B5A182_9TELE|nr:PREDICTED: ataxin-1-like [Stegastes partitus]